MKLYTIRIIVEGIVLADSAEEARRFCGAIMDTEDMNIVEVDEGETVHRHWSSQALVYGDHDEDLTLADARKRASAD